MVKLCSIINSLYGQVAGDLVTCSRLCQIMSPPRLRLGETRFTTAVNKFPSPLPRDRTNNNTTHLSLIYQYILFCNADRVYQTSQTSKHSKLYLLQFQLKQNVDLNMYILRCVVLHTFNVQQFHKYDSFIYFLHVYATMKHVNILATTKSVEL